jgi:ATP/ADP translocase
MISCQSKDDVLTLLIHLEYLAYDETKSEVYIPNEEIKSEFKNAVEGNQ